MSCRRVKGERSSAGWRADTCLPASLRALQAANATAAQAHELAEQRAGMLREADARGAVGGEAGGPPQCICLATSLPVPRAAGDVSRRHASELRAAGEALTRGGVSLRGDATSTRAASPPSDERTAAVEHARAALAAELKAVKDQSRVRELEDEAAGLRAELAALAAQVRGWGGRAGRPRSSGQRMGGTSWRMTRPCTPPPPTTTPYYFFYFYYYAPPSPPSLSSLSSLFYHSPYTRTPLPCQREELLSLLEAHNAHLGAAAAETQDLRVRRARDPFDDARGGIHSSLASPPITGPPRVVRARRSGL